MADRKLYWKGEHNPFPYISNSEVETPGGFDTPTINIDNNLVQLDLNGATWQQFHNIIDFGAQVLYPDEYAKFVETWLCGLMCPPIIEGEQEVCYNYPPYAPFVEFYPQSPYLDTTTVPPGYGGVPWLIRDGSPTFPYNYDVGDVYAPFTSMNVGLNAFTGELAGFKVTVVGSGQLEVDFLGQIFGGKVIVGINKPPNLIDILLAIWNTSADFIFELELNAAEIPPDDGVVIPYELVIDEPPGTTTEIYFSFLPVGDFDDIPIGYGGGVRSIGLCGFENAGTIVGFTDARRVGNDIEFFQNGQWQKYFESLEDCDAVENCLTTSPTITTIQGDIATNQTNIANNTTQIAQNDTDIFNINSSLVGINNSINTINSTLIDHNKRISELENTQILVPITDQVTRLSRREIGRAAATTTGIKTLTISGIDANRLYIIIRGRSDVAGADKDVQMWVGNDRVGGNYDSSRDDLTQSSEPLIARMPSDDGANDYFGFATIKMDNAQDIAKNATANSVSNSISGDSDQMANDVYAWVYEGAVAIDELQFEFKQPSDWAVGSEIIVYAEEDTDFLVFADGWIATLDFRVNSWASALTVNSGSYNTDHYEAPGSPAFGFLDIEFNNTTSDTARIRALELDWFISLPDLTSWGLKAGIVGQPLLEFTPEISGSLMTHRFGLDETTSENIQFQVGADFDSPMVAGARAELYQIRIFGQGEIPTPYIAFIAGNFPEPQ